MVGEVEEVEEEVEEVEEEVDEGVRDHLNAMGASMLFELLLNGSNIL